MLHVQTSPSNLQASHAAAMARARKIAAREPGVISTYDLGLLIADIEADQLGYIKVDCLDMAIALNSVIRRLKKLIPVS